MKRILIADDEPSALRVMKMTLEKAGYMVETVPNGAEALESFRRDAPDVLITDIAMPHMTGEQLCKQLCTEFPNMNTLVFVVTSRTEKEHRDWAKALPRSEFIEKPISLKLLMRKLEEHFNNPVTSE